jgi:hypothetical protein
MLWSARLTYATNQAILVWVPGLGSSRKGIALQGWDVKNTEIYISPSIHNRMYFCPSPALLHIWAAERKDHILPWRVCSDPHRTCRLAHLVHARRLVPLLCKHCFWKHRFLRDNGLLGDLKTWHFETVDSDSTHPTANGTGAS